MTRLLAIFCFLALFTPLVHLLWRVLPVVYARSLRDQRPSARAGLALSLLLPLLLVSLFLFTGAHDDLYTGLDNMAYRTMAESILAGRPLVGEDPTAALVPRKLASAFHYRPEGKLRPTRDLVFQIDSDDDKSTIPFFEPFLPLAAAGSGMPRHFIPLVGLLWFTLLLFACYGRHGEYGILAACALAIATPWPSWFLRGYYAEGVGAVLAAAVFLSANTRPFRSSAAFLLGGFALGLSGCCHPTALLVAAPVALSLLPSARRPAHAAPLVIGGFVGLFPVWAFTRWVCQPYGDWTRLDKLRQILFSAREHLALGIALLALLAFALAALALAASPRGRRLCARLDRALSPWGWMALTALPLLLALLIPSPFRTPLRLGASSYWNGIRVPCAILWAACAILCYLRSRIPRPAPRILLALLAWSLLPFLLVTGVEKPVGIWSLRRLLPTTLLLTALFAPPFGGFLRRFATSHVHCARALAFAALFLACASLIRWPAAYFADNERGALRFRDTVEESLRPADLVVFDYFPHSVPFSSFTTRTRVLGLGKHASRHWPKIVRWLATLAPTSTVFIVTSWSPTPLEDGLALKPSFSAGATFPTVKSKLFFPAELAAKTVTNHFALALPLTNGAPAPAQHKILDGGPIGLRGHWAPSPRGGMWTRQGSGVVGPVSPHVTIRLDAAWFPPSGQSTPQRMLVTPPGTRKTVSFEVPPGRHVLTLRLDLDNTSKPTGVYRFSSPTPFDPTGGKPGGEYPPDLGVVLHSIDIVPTDE